MAASTLVTLSIIVLFFFTQKSFIEGISMTGIKDWGHRAMTHLCVTAHKIQNRRKLRAQS
jgi:hypothetical protein